jgi:hypothetical protein
MVKVIHLADDGTELASIEVDDFTLEVIYAGLAEMLREAALSRPPAAAPGGALSREARQRRERVLGRVRT